VLMTAAAMIVGMIPMAIGFGESGPYATRKAYDLLIQAEVGLSSITGTTEPSRVGVSVVDIATGMNAYEAILGALIARHRTPAKAPNFRFPCSIRWPTGWRCR